MFDSLIEGASVREEMVVEERHLKDISENVGFGRST